MTVYKTISIVGTSGTSLSDAIRGAVQRAGESVDDLKWFEVKDIRGRVAGNEVDEFQVSLDLSFVVHAYHEGGEVEAASQRAGTRQTRSEEAQQAAARGERKRSDLARGFEEQPPRAR